MRRVNLSLIPLAMAFIGLGFLLLYYYPEPTHPPVFSFELPYPFSFAHSVFLSLAVIAASYFFGRAFLAKGSVSLLMLGGASLVLGLGYLLSQILGNQPLGGPNQLVGISSTAFLLSGGFYSAFAILNMLNRDRELRNRRVPLVLFYTVGVLAVAGTVLVFETSQAPTFFAPGIGPTLLRGLVLGLAILLYAFTSVSLILSHLRLRNDILYWFSLGTAAITVGFLVALLGKVPGGPYSWLGRICLELGGVYIILAILTAYRSKPNK